MAENTPTNAGPVDKNGANDRLEQKKKEALASGLELAVKIIENDESITRSVAEIMKALAHEVQKNPKEFFSNGGADIQALVTALKAKSEGSSAGSGVSGGDIVGGLSWSDIVDTIKALEGFLKDEKGFVMDILRLIFCGCKGTGW